MSKDKKHVYEILEENPDNTLESKLVKRGVDVEFTMQQMDDHTTQALSTLDQWRGQLNLEDAKMKNVEEHHPDAITLVKDLDPVKQNAIHIWLKAKEIIDMVAPRRDELEQRLEEHKAELEEIKKQTGWVANVTEDVKKEDTKEQAD